MTPKPFLRLCPVFRINPNAPRISHLSLGRDCPNQGDKQQDEPCESNRRAVQRVNWHDILVDAWYERINDNNRNDDREESLEDPTDKIVSTVRAFEKNWIDSGLFPHLIRSPKECSNHVCDQIDGKEIS